MFFKLQLIISHSGIDDKTFSRAKQAKTLAFKPDACITNFQQGAEKRL